MNSILPQYKYKTRQKFFKNLIPRDTCKSKVRDRGYDSRSGTVATKMRRLIKFLVYRIVNVKIYTCM
jgi:hypothetical protein